MSERGAPSNYHELGVDCEGTPHCLFGGDPDLHEPDSQCGCDPDWHHDDTPGDPGWWSHHA